MCHGLNRRIVHNGRAGGTAIRRLACRFNGRPLSTMANAGRAILAISEAPPPELEHPVAILMGATI